MQSFIFDYYGYNANIENNEFEYEGYKFLLLSVEDDEKDIIKLNDLVNSLNIHFNSDVVFIVKNKYDKYMNCGWYDVSANRCFLLFNDGWN